LTVQEAIRTARERARQMKVDPSLTIAEVYEAELLRRLQQKLKGGLVWKGGTVLRLEGSERFSRDLDASRRSTALAAGQIVKLLQGIAEGLAYLKGVSIKRQPQSVVAAYRFAIEGILHPLRIVVEVSLRERILRAPTTISTARIAHRWGLEPVVVARLDPEELLAEKVRALVMRMAGRDIFDVYWLLQRGTEFDLQLFLRKMRYYSKVRARVDPVEAIEKAIARLEKYGPGRAKTEIVNLFPAAQRNLDFAVIVEDVLRALRSWHNLLTS
jgi:predicted nucleotidyltransferase component of viral defense system